MIYEELIWIPKPSLFSILAIPINHAFNHIVTVTNVSIKYGDLRNTGMSYHSGDNVI